MLRHYSSYMSVGDVDSFYREFGKLVQHHRRQQETLTQEKLGQIVGLSRTSITNIEKGRQHVALHQLFALAEALKIRPEALLPALAPGVGPSWVSKNLPPGTDKEISEWVEKVVRS